MRPSDAIDGADDERIQRRLVQKLLVMPRAFGEPAAEKSCRAMNAGTNGSRSPPTMSTARGAIDPITHLGGRSSD